MIISTETPVQTFTGPANAKIIFISGVPGWEGEPFSPSAKAMLQDFGRRANISTLEMAFACVLPEVPVARKLENAPASLIDFGKAKLLEKLETLSPTILVPCDNLALNALTEHTAISKWHLSVIPATKSSRKFKTMPLLHPEVIFRDYTQVPFFTFGFMRLREEMNSSLIKSTPRIFHTFPSLDQSLKFLGRCMFADYLSVDIETKQGQISCIGLAMTPSEAMCIPTLPENWTKNDFFTIWTWIADVLGGPSKKVFQNFLYDTSYFSRYGIRVRNLWHDTMHAQKFLHPELPAGLDTIARIYTREPYWKDEGKDWKNVQDINKFYLYNCKDAAATLEAAFGQEKDLESRNLAKKFYTYTMHQARIAAEMSWRGLPIDAEKRSALRLEFDAQVAELNNQLSAHTTSIMGDPLNSRSPKQVKEYFKKKGYRIPVKKGKETSDVTAILKLQQKYPEDKSLGLLVQLSELNKMVSSYLKPMPYPDGRMRYRLNVTGTDTLRWSSGLDPWDNGFNAQTMPRDFKKMLVAPPGFVWLECDLKQADARFVAWDAPEPTLIKFFTEGRDIHRFVASRPELFNKPESEITNDERQLGKKTGHAANYGMRGQTHADACLREMGIVLTPTRAQQMLDGYHRTFPGIHMWQARIRQEINRTKKLNTPLGWERIFYGRLDDNLYRAAYAFRPQCTVSFVIGELLRHMDINRNPEKLHHILQVHDSYIALCREEYLDEAVKLIADENAWNPKMSLAGGTLQIPIELKAGPILKDAKEIHLC